MPRSPLIVALAAGLLILLSTVNILHRSGRSGWGAFFSRQPQQQPLDIHSYPTTSSRQQQQQYLLGVGKADITGPVVEINFMGYANASQVGSGLRQRIYSRAFIIGDVDKPAERFVYLVLDTQSGDTAIRHGILQALADLGDGYAVYGHQNVAITGTHSHSGPAAWLNYLLPQITSKGFNKQSYHAIVDGAVESIKLAHANLEPGHLSVGTTEINDASVSRSPYAYLQNPAEERARYDHDVDKTMTMLRFTHVESSGEETDIGVLTWFAVHGTSMLGNNTLVTGDNKGVAAWMFEKSMNNPSFVAGFSQANVGDTSPNILGAFCESGPQEGQMCDFKTSLCDGKNEPCHGRGPYPGLNDGGTASAYEIGRRQYAGAASLFSNSSAFTPISSPIIRSLHQFADFSTFHFTLPNSTAVRTCPAALGFSFAAGTTDGPGAFDFKQAQPGDPHANPLWAVVGGLLHTPNDTQRECQGVKPILLDVGETDTPYAWSPNIVDIQLLRVGNFFIIVSPGEATTMSGRRWREALSSHALKSFPEELNTISPPVVVLGAPANSYTHYIATPEEYSVQRYEGASTLYGPWTLDGYINKSLSLLPYLSSTSQTLPPLAPGPSPPINVNNSLSFITGVVVDNAGFLKSFGDQVTGPRRSYSVGETVEVEFVGANPRNNLRLGGTFATVEKFMGGRWEMVRDDADWSLVYEWRRVSSVLGTSHVKMRWEMKWETKWETGAWRPQQEASGSGSGELLARDAADLKGLYRFVYYGDSKALGGKITAFTGTSDEFVVE